MKISFNWKTAFFSVFISFILLNLVLVDLYIIKKGTNVQTESNSISQVVPFAKETQSLPVQVQDSPLKNASPEANIDFDILSSIIQTATSSLSLKVEELLAKPKVANTIPTQQTSRDRKSVV